MSKKEYLVTSVHTITFTQQSLQKADDFVEAQAIHQARMIKLPRTQEERESIHMMQSPVQCKALKVGD